MSKVLFGLSIFMAIGCWSFVTNELVVAELSSTIDCNVYDGEPNYKAANTIKIISFQDMDAYLMKIARDGTIYELQKTGEVITKKVYDTVAIYFIFKNGAQKGLRFDSLSAVKGRKFDIDTLYGVINMGKHNRQKFMQDGDRLTYSLHDSKTGKLAVEKYIQNRANESDSIYRYYDYSMRDIRFSISPLLEEKKQNKIVKIAFITNPKITNGVKKNREEFVISLKRSSYEDTQQLLKLFDVFKKESERLHLNQ